MGRPINCRCSACTTDTTGTTEEPPVGACCEYVNGSTTCTVVTEVTCFNRSRVDTVVWLEGQDCSPNPCPTTTTNPSTTTYDPSLGSCCRTYIQTRPCSDGSDDCLEAVVVSECVGENVPESACQGQGMSWSPGKSCQEAGCGETTTPSPSTTTNPATVSDSSTTSNPNGNQIGACCDIRTGDCVGDYTQNFCNSLGENYRWQGQSTSCDNGYNCPIT